MGLKLVFLVVSRAMSLIRLSHRESWWKDIEAHNVNNLTLYDVDLVNAPIFHVYFEGGNGLTVWGVRIKTPATARNTDGIDADSFTNVTVNDSFIQDGDDGIAIKTNSGAASDMTVENSHFYGTHGISIGSQTQHGVSNILVQNNTVSGTDSAGNVSTDNNGIRIKTDSSEGGKVSDVTYENTCVTGVKHAMEFNPFYASGNGSTTPDFTDIVVLGLRAVSSASSAQSVLEGFSTADPLARVSEFRERHPGLERRARVRSAGKIDAEAEVEVPHAVAGQAHQQRARPFQPARHLQAAGIQRAQPEALDEPRHARLGPCVVAGEEHVQRAALCQDVAEDCVERLHDVRARRDGLGDLLRAGSADATSTSSENANMFDTNFTPSGTDVTVTSTAGSGSVPGCTFPSYPGL